MSLLTLLQLNLETVGGGGGVVPRAPARRRRGIMDLRQSTASQEIPLGPFVDSTDGNTEETGLTIANTDIKLWKSGATSFANKNSGGATHMANGMYYAVLDATDTNTIGPMTVYVHVAGALTVELECRVLHATLYDQLYGSTALSTLDASGIRTAVGLASANIDTQLSAIVTDTAEIGVAGAGLTNINLPDQTMNIVGNITGNLSGSVGSVTAGVSVGTGGITSTSFGAGAIDAAAIAADAIGSAELAASAVTEIQSGLSTLTAANVNAEMVDVLNVDTYAQPGQEAPAATTTLSMMLRYCYKLLRNRITQDATTLSIYADNGTTVDQKATTSDDGTTYVRGKIGAGP